MNKQYILRALKSKGFIDTGKKGWGNHHRITHNKIQKGSLYVGDFYISGTGGYKKIKDKIPPSSYDRHKYPEWTGNKTLKMLEYLENNF